MVSTKCTRVSEPMQTLEVLVSSSRRWRELRTSDVTWPILSNVLLTVTVTGVDNVTTFSAV